ncbi:MAG: GNAT family N-acetyltransferase [Parachlamydiaceae bacterium]
MDQQFLSSFDRNIQGKFSYLPSHHKQMTIQCIENVTFIDSGLHSNMFNILYCSDRSIDRASIHMAIDLFSSKNIPYAFWTGFEDDPSWLEEELLALGLVTEETEWAMVCDLDKHVATVTFPNFDIRQINDSTQIEDIITVMNQILPCEEHSAIASFYHQSALPLLSKESSLIFFAAYENRRPIALSSLFYDQAVASIFDVIVLPEMRGKGLGQAMTLKAMLRAQEKRFQTCVLTATNDAKHLYKKLGFKDIKTMKVYHQP